MTKKHMKKSSPSLVFREVQIKTTMNIPTYLLECKTLKGLTTLSVGEDMEQVERSYFAGGNVKWYKHFGKAVKHTLTLCHSLSTLTYLLKVKAYVHIKTCTQMFVAALFAIIISIGKQSKCLLAGEWMNCCTGKQWNTT